MDHKPAENQQQLTEGKPENGVSTAAIPSWIDEAHFIDILKQNVEGFDRILKFKAAPAMAAGENYTTLIVRIGIDVQLKDKSEQNISFILKIPEDSEQMKELRSLVNFFDNENQTYNDIIPELEELYRKAGQTINFGPKPYTFIKQPDCDFVLMEDLCPSGFKNANRLEGLDMEHTKVVLKKLAQFHAASAERFALKGSYPDRFTFNAFGEGGVKFFASMVTSLQEPFLNNMKTWKDGEKYYPIMENFFANFENEFRFLTNVENEFLVLNHGDFWANNILFNYDSAGHVLDTRFVDFQSPRFSVPVQDLIHFLISSTNIEIKLKHFDYFVHYYHDHLVESLKLLKYPNKIPSLRELHMQLYKYGTYAVLDSVFALSAVLVDSTEAAKLDNFFSNNKEAQHFKNLLYSNKRFHRHIEELLPWLHNRGLLETRRNINEINQKLLPSPNQKQAPLPATVAIPSWIDEDHFIDILQEKEGFDRILQFKAAPAMAPGENYATLMLRVGIDVQLKDKSEQHISYMLKVPHSNEQMNEMVSFINVFANENQVYDNVLPELEKLYKNAGKTLSFGPKPYKFDKKPDCDVVLLEDLGPRGFKNVNRLECLDMEHTECVLKKLAQFHAGSATRFALKGAYPEHFSFQSLGEKGLQFFNTVMTSFQEPFLNNVKIWKDGDLYYQVMKKYFNNFEEEFKYLVNCDKGFQVLNHGDFWCNNILFNYDSAGHVTDTIFVDFQMPKFSTPVLDLMRFLMSSTKIEIKLKHFDYFIRYYHEILVENLKLLKYPNKIPTLSELHMDLYKYGGYAVLDVVVGLPVVLLDATEAANFENFFNDDKDGMNFKNSLYTGKRYRRYIQEMLPWLYNRGWLDCSVECKK